MALNIQRFRSVEFRTTFPGSQVWTVLHILFGLIRTPLWVLLFIPKFLRQDSRWTYKQAMRVRMMRAILTWLSDTEHYTPLSLAKNHEYDQWVLVDPPAPKYFAGITLADESIDPTRIGGTWYPRNFNREKIGTGKVVLHFHGGAFVIGDGRRKDTEFLAAALYNHAGVASIFAVQYRLSIDRYTRFPAALQDAISTYMYLTDELDIPAEQIILSGDSAGANIVLAFLRYLSEHGKRLEMPTPFCAWLWSAWVNPSAEFHDEAGRRDYVTKPFGNWGSSKYHPDKSTGLTLDNEYINFLDYPFKTDVPLYFSAGECEALYETDKKTAEQFAKITGNKVEFTMEPRAVHDIILVGANSGFHEEAFEAARKARKWMETL